MSSAPPPRFIAPQSHEPVAPERETAWKPWTAFAALVAGFFAAFAGQLVIAAVATLFGATIEDPPPAVLILSTLFQDFAFIGAAIFFARSVGPVMPSQFGLRKTPLWPAIGAALATMVAFYFLSAVWAAIIDTGATDELPDSLGVEESTYALIGVCVLVTVVAPLAEEFLFRGYMFGALRNWRGVWPAAIITGVIFGGIHAAGTDAEFLPPLMLLGFLLCLLRWRTGSLLPCIALHAVNNSIAFGVTAADWDAWAIVLLVVGSVSACMAICWPFVGRRSDRAIGAAT
ncbi:MAG TPA: type II CAAX endopeptidase family protein [Conexibacter sp.]|nr:type II CAAX endopeptidase family protein [Conexibacter sp.]